MRTNRTTTELNKDYQIDLVQTNGNIDYIKSGNRVVNAPLRSIMVTEQSDLASLVSLYEPGTIAFTAGFGSMWQLAADGTWKSI